VQVRISANLDAAYNEYYGEDISEWRELGAKYKAENIVRVCGAHRFRKVLECGAGEGSILHFLDAARCFDELHAIEISDSGIARINDRRLASLESVQKFDGYVIPFPDDAFDMAYCSHVIEHVEHPRLLLRELKRVSRFQVFEVPLDYTVDVDKKVAQFVSFGHINVYTPATFKFLLRSEGFEIVTEHLSQVANDVVRYNMYVNQKRVKNVVREARLLLRPLRNLLLRLRMGRARYREYCYSAYTCLTTRSA
jgi:ubiquinone/menaquinone biosynthesis C-methylase UbiE